MVKIFTLREVALLNREIPLFNASRRMAHAGNPWLVVEPSAAV
jgi:hypothetical protein